MNYILLGLAKQVLLQFLIAIIIAPLCKINSQVILLFCFYAATAEYWETLVNKKWTTVVDWGLDHHQPL